VQGKEAFWWMLQPPAGRPMLTVEIPGYGRLALGHLFKRKAQPIEIVEAIRAVSGGKAILSPGVAGCILDEVIQERGHSAPQT
jgi:hypothetical protein